LAKGADTILITGAVQSNYVRAAAAAAKLGLGSVLQLESRVPDMGALYQTSGNVFLSQLLGAEHMHFAEGEDENGADAALHTKACRWKNTLCDSSGPEQQTSWCFGLCARRA
jgi:1-aminocyclopropane-1-carboxylate deaminase/D-cysteine desulfhydrase-like pyridoxal-dependent ACC family enzyme